MLPGAIKATPHEIIQHMSGIRLRVIAPSTMNHGFRQDLCSALVKGPDQSRQKVERFFTSHPVDGPKTTNLDMFVQGTMR